MTRAQETGELISEQLDCDIPIYDCQLIEEGAPIPPEPPVGHWKPEPKVNFIYSVFFFRYCETQATQRKVLYIDLHYYY